jgi:hypothetical protein
MAFSSLSTTQTLPVRQQLSKKFALGVIALACTSIILPGCSITGIPAHGGGKRYATEQRLVSASIRAALRDIDVTMLKGKRVALVFDIIADEGGGNMSGGRIIPGLLFSTGSVLSPVTSTNSAFQVFNLGESGSNYSNSGGSSSSSATTVTVTNGTGSNSGNSAQNSNGTGTNTGTSASTTYATGSNTGVNASTTTGAGTNTSTTTGSGTNTSTTTGSGTNNNTNTNNSSGTNTATTGGTTTNGGFNQTGGSTDVGTNTNTSTTNGSNTNTATTNGSSTNTATTNGTNSGTNQSTGTTNGTTTGANTSASTTNGTSNGTNTTNNTSTSTQSGGSESSNSSSGGFNNNRQTLSPQPTQTTTQTEGKREEKAYSLSYQGLGTYQNIAVPKSDAGLLMGLVRNYLMFSGAIPTIPTDPRAEVLVYVTVDVFGTVRSRFDALAYNNESVRAETSFEISAYDRDGKMIMRPTVANREAKFQEHYLFWAGPLITQEQVNKGKGLLVDFTDVDGTKSSYPVKEEAVNYPLWSY